MQADRNPQPPPSMSPSKKPPGRPEYYGIDQLMQVWLFVMGPGGADRSYGVGKETLRSLYQRAVRILRDEQEEHDAFVLALGRAGASSSQEVKPLPIATLWHAELQRRLALSG
jgi:hypothetical protein